MEEVLLCCCAFSASQIRDRLWELSDVILLIDDGLGLMLLF
jgi:hypothetical protein